MAPSYRKRVGSDIDVQHSPSVGTTGVQDEDVRHQGPSYGDKIVKTGQTGGLGTPTTTYHGQHSPSLGLTLAQEEDGRHQGPSNGDVVMETGLTGEDGRHQDSTIGDKETGQEGGNMIVETVQHSPSVGNTNVRVEDGRHQAPSIGDSKTGQMHGDMIVKPIKTGGDMIVETVQHSPSVGNADVRVEDSRHQAPSSGDSKTIMTGGDMIVKTVKYSPSVGTTQGRVEDMDLILKKEDILKEDDFKDMEDDLEDPWLETLSDQESFLELTASFIKDNPPCSPETPASRTTKILHHTPGRQEQDRLLSENPGLGPLSTTIRDGLVGDQSWPTRRGEGVNESHKIVGHASFADEGPEGLLSKKEEQECVEAGFLTGQTDRQTVCPDNDDEG